MLTTLLCKVSTKGQKQTNLTEKTTQNRTIWIMVNKHHSRTWLKMPIPLWRGLPAKDCCMQQNHNQRQLGRSLTMILETWYLRHLSIKMLQIRLSSVKCQISFTQFCSTTSIAMGQKRLSIQIKRITGLPQMVRQISTSTWISAISAKTCMTWASLWSLSIKKKNLCWTRQDQTSIWIGQLCLPLVMEAITNSVAHQSSVETT